MQKMTKTTTVYIACDDTEFTDPKLCQAYEDRLYNLKFFKVYTGYDNAIGFTTVHMIAVDAPYYHRNVVDKFCVDELGLKMIVGPKRGKSWHPGFAVLDSNRKEWDGFKKGVYVTQTLGETKRFGERFLLSSFDVPSIDAEKFNYLKKWKLLNH